MFNLSRLSTIITIIISLACLVKTDDSTTPHDCTLAYNGNTRLCQDRVMKHYCNDCRAPRLDHEKGMHSYHEDPQNKNNYVVAPFTYTGDANKGPIWIDDPIVSVPKSRVEIASCQDCNP
ncbi:hypothetical protein DFH28DRAFT_955667 [Melampsora americana]|nr:hypothetical protein DFH28DRAFT_955667 [Melampsora americana]